MLLDEVSQVPLALASCLEHLHNAGTKIVCFGDEWQLQPVEPTWRGKPVEPDALMRARLLKLWCDGTCFELTHYWRSTDRTFAVWFMQARHTDRKTAIADALARFPAKSGSADWYLCLSHRRCCSINAE